MREAAGRTVDCANSLYRLGLTELIQGAYEQSIGHLLRSAQLGQIAGNDRIRDRGLEWLGKAIAAARAAGLRPARFEEALAHLSGAAQDSQDTE
jgi:hypothetical protein